MLNILNDKYTEDTLMVDIRFLDKQQQYLENVVIVIRAMRVVN